MLKLAALAIALGLVWPGCERAKPAPAPVPVTTPAPVVPAPDASVTEIGDELVAFASAELLPYLDGVLQIMRDAKGDCVVAARGLEGRATAFAQLATRVVELRARVDALDPADQQRAEQRVDHLIAEARARYTDAEAIMRMASECTKSTPAFAAVSDRVMFTKKTKPAPAPP